MEDDNQNIREDCAQNKIKNEEEKQNFLLNI